MRTFQSIINQNCDKHFSFLRKGRSNGYYLATYFHSKLGTSYTLVFDEDFKLMYNTQIHHNPNLSRAIALEFAKNGMSPSEESIYNIIQKEMSIKSINKRYWELR